MNDIKHLITHWVGALLAIVAVGLFIVNPILARMDSTHLSGPSVTVTQPQAKNSTTRAADTAATLIKDQAVIAALQHQVLQLSAGQQAIARVAEQAGASANVAAGLAYGLTKPSPKVQVVTVGTTSNSKLVAPAPALTDDQIERSLKKVISETTIKNDTHTTVDINWQDKPLSPILTAYNSDGAAGAGLTLKKGPVLNLDALVFTKANAFEVGVGAEHIFRGTSAGLGVDTTFNTRTKGWSVGVFAGIHY